MFPTGFKSPPDPLEGPHSGAKEITTAKPHRRDYDEVNEVRSTIGKCNCRRAVSVVDVGHHLLTDKGVPSQTQAIAVYGEMPVDDYVWLDERPVMAIRSELTGTSNYYSASSGTVDQSASPQLNNLRNGLSGRTETYFIVTDNIGRPVLALDKNMIISGVGDYDPFGNVNRVQRFIESAHPYINGTRYSGGGLGVAVQSNQLFVDFRVHYLMRDYLGLPSSDTPQIVLPDGGVILTAGQANGTPYQDSSATKEGWTGWFSQAYQPPAIVTFKVGSGGAPSSYSGFVIDQFEYRRAFSPWPWFPPMRNQGMYFDWETDLFENWNRYYDPSTGRYLSPEPMLQNPGYVKSMAMRGQSVSTYAYAGNNPIMKVDRDGLKPGDPFNTPEDALWDAQMWLWDQLNAGWEGGWGLEHGGLIYRKAEPNQCIDNDNAWRATPAITGTPFAVDYGKMLPNLDNAIIWGNYHNHPKGLPFGVYTYDPVDGASSQDRNTFPHGGVLEPQGHTHWW